MSKLGGIVYWLLEASEIVMLSQGHSCTLDQWRPWLFLFLYCLEQLKTLDLSIFRSIDLKDFHNTSTEFSTLLEKVMQVLEYFHFTNFIFSYVLRCLQDRVRSKLNGATFGYNCSGNYVPQLSWIVFQRNKGTQNSAINFRVSWYVIQ